MKQSWLHNGQRGKPAAFRRLCVETIHGFEERKNEIAAAFRRLCVETL